MISKQSYGIAVLLPFAYQFLRCMITCLISRSQQISDLGLEPIFLAPRAGCKERESIRGQKEQLNRHGMGAGREDFPGTLRPQVSLETRDLQGRYQKELVFHLPKAPSSSKASEILMRPGEEAS